ncbi:Phosphoglycerate dehydrogenase [Polaromonas sp. YR568]|uniref:D-2-hydroxyacid dehydrogenase n=1 Tax=Polaromonas sp. YR568 TaxID=1855301 RepID=UPI0008E0A1A1|nr:D-2-hydroxyacid dehydrogenase [Polaromonas sp. YR568]SFU89572.1 Phosphoglycerate dehydrogenase [Polaromonas sp. YR568]
MMHVYVENQAGRAATYSITPEVFRCALPMPETEVTVTIHDSDRPDLDALARADVFVGSGFDVERLRRGAPRLKLVHCTSAGVERYLPLDWLPQGAKFTNSSGIHVQKAREYAAMALLMLNSEMPFLISNQREKRWSPRLTPPIEGQRVLVVGLGRLGCAVASAAGALGLKVEGISRHGRSVDGVAEVSRIDALAERIQVCDFLILCCPLTKETRGLLHAGLIGSMKRGAGIVNMARGQVVVTADVIEALKSGQLGGAVLDVFDTEPLPPEAAVWDVPNLIVTPHVSCDMPTGYTGKSMKILARNLARLRAGEQELENEVDPELGY